MCPPLKLIINTDRNYLFTINVIPDEYCTVNQNFTTTTANFNLKIISSPPETSNPSVYVVQITDNGSLKGTSSIGINLPQQLVWSGSSAPYVPGFGYFKTMMIQSDNSITEDSASEDLTGTGSAAPQINNCKNIKLIIYTDRYYKFTITMNPNENYYNPYCAVTSQQFQTEVNNFQIDMSPVDITVPSAYNLKLTDIPTGESNTFMISSSDENYFCGTDKSISGFGNIKQINFELTDVDYGNSIGFSQKTSLIKQIVDSIYFNGAICTSKLPSISNNLAFISNGNIINHFHHLYTS
jgi:hypothetical protein